MDLLLEVKNYLLSLDEQSAFLAFLFVAVFLTVLGGVGLLLARDPVARRLAYGSSTATAAAGAHADAGVRDSAPRFTTLDKLWTPQTEADQSRIRDQLFRAGYRRRSAVRNYYAIRVLFGLVIPFGIGIAFPLISRNIDITHLLLLTCILITIGFYFPMLWVVRQAQRRQVAIRDGFPDALDMMLVCVEAGLGLDAALDRVAHEIEPGHPIIAEELILCGLELRAGKPRVEVLRDLARRVDVDDVRAFVAVLTQSDRYGTSLSEAIRTYALEMRQKRLLRAEEKANKLPVKMALGAIIFTLPPVMMVMISPALISVFRFLNRLTE